MHKHGSNVSLTLLLLFNGGRYEEVHQCVPQGLRGGLSKILDPPKVSGRYGDERMSFWAKELSRTAITLAWRKEVVNVRVQLIA